MTKSRVEMSETYCVMRRRTSIIAMAKTTLETAMTFTCSCIGLDAAGTGLQPGYMGAHSLGAWRLQPRLGTWRPPHSGGHGAAAAARAWHVWLQWWRLRTASVRPARYGGGQGELASKTGFISKSL